MKVGIFLHKYFPYGGQQRDFIGIAQALLDQGAEVEVFLLELTEELPLKNVMVHKIRCPNLTNAGRAKQFARRALKLSEERDVQIRLGFVKMGGLDFYFCADGCLKSRCDGWVKKLLPRYRTYLSLEAAVFDNPNTVCFGLTRRQIEDYKHAYGMSEERFVLVKPNLREEFRQCVRSKILFKGEHRLLFVASNLRLKGLDRVLLACSLACLVGDKKKVLMVAGSGECEFPFLKEARDKGWEVRFLGPVKALRKIYAEATLLVHPARKEAGGLVLLEALSQGLPVIASEECGYAQYVAEAKAGEIVPNADDPTELVRALEDMLNDESKLLECSRNAREFMTSGSFYSSHKDIAKTLLLRHRV